MSEVHIVEDMARYGLHVELGAGVEKLSLDELVQPRFNPEYDESLADELGDDYDPDALWITRVDRWTHVEARLRALGYRATAQGTPYESRVIFRVRRLSGASAPE